MHEFDASQWNSRFRMRTTLRQDQTHQLMWENRSPKAEHGVKVLKVLEIATFHPTQTHAFQTKKYISLLTLKGLWLPTRAATEMIKGSQGANWRMECMSSREFLRANAHKLSQPPRAPSHSPEYTMVVERTCVDLVLIWLLWLCWHERPATNLIWYAINGSFVRNNCFDIRERNQPITCYPWFNSNLICLCQLVWPSISMGDPVNAKRYGTSERPWRSERWGPRSWVSAFDSRSFSYAFSFWSDLIKKQNHHQPSSTHMYRFCR